MVSRLMAFNNYALNMDLWSFWQSVAALRKVEFMALLVTIGIPLISVTILLTLRHRIKTLQSQLIQNRGTFYQDNVQRLMSRNHALTKELGKTQTELSILKRVTAPRQITPLQEDILLDKLRGFKAAPVIVAAYAFEKESASYATQIASVLRKANWDVTLSKSSMNDFKGISLGKINLMHQPIAGLHELAQAFTEAQMDLRTHEIPPDSIAGPLQDGSLLVIVGRR